MSDYCGSEDVLLLKKHEQLPFDIKNCIQRTAAWLAFLPPAP